MCNTDIQPTGMRAALGEKVRTTYDVRAAEDPASCLQWQVIVDSKQDSISGGAALKCWTCKELIFGARADYAVFFVIYAYAAMPPKVPSLLNVARRHSHGVGASSSGGSSTTSKSASCLPLGHEPIYRYRQSSLIAGLHMPSRVASAIHGQIGGRNQAIKRYVMMLFPPAKACCCTDCRVSRLLGC